MQAAVMGQGFRRCLCSCRLHAATSAACQHSRPVREAFQEVSILESMVRSDAFSCTAHSGDCCTPQGVKFCSCSAVCDDHHEGRSCCHRHCADDNIHHCNMRPRLCGKGVLSACPGAWVPYVLWSFMHCRTISTQQGWVNAATISIAIRCTALFDLSTSQYGFP